ncbi:MAG: hypothetical protein R6X06_07150 [Gammaproteobacteria bacterium]
MDDMDASILVQSFGKGEQNMRVLTMLVMLAVVTVAVMYFMNMNIAPSTEATPVQVQVQAQDTSPKILSSETRVIENDQPETGFLVDKYMDYLKALDANQSADEVLAMFATKWREGMLQRASGKNHLLGYLRMNQLEKDFQVMDTQYMTRTNTPNGQDGKYAVLHLKGELAVMGDAVTSQIYFYREAGEWKLSGELSSMMEQMMSADTVDGWLASDPNYRASVEKARQNSLEVEKRMQQYDTERY